MKIKATFKLVCSAIMLACVGTCTCSQAQITGFNILNAAPDISQDFRSFENTYYLPDKLVEFNPETASGKIKYDRHNYATAQLFNNMLSELKPAPQNEFPKSEYEASPVFPFSIQFVSPRTVRIRAVTGPQYRKEEASLMLVNGTAPESRSSWKYSKLEGGHQYKSAFGTVIIKESPWKVELLDANGKLLTNTVRQSDLKSLTPVMPFSYVRRAQDYSRSMHAAFSLQPNEKIFGCGESFTGLDKRGQKVTLWVDDAVGVQNESMYKPIPFFMSSRGYGMFMHTSAPITCDFGKFFSGINSLYIGDDELDLFVFLGQPKDILDEYTNLTGKAAMPPLWSFGLWMSRITYFSEADGRKVAANLRKNKVPADVVHFDTGWFGTEWRTDYEFAADRFTDPVKMISDLKKDGFHISLWQLPYFTPKNRLFPEIVEKGLAVKDGKGNLPYEDAILDFSNPAAVSWYQEKIGNLLKQGVGAIKVDFGEAAPATGLYHSGKSGFYEHNLYPLRYNKAVAEITKQINNENIIWARSTWAGSQRYPLHWGGDAANSNTAMAATLRAGLSLGLSGFSFWSHDIGGFAQRSPEELYRRWVPFGMLTSHARAHGSPPKEPWEYSKEFLNDFRLAAEMRYQLMPYIYAQAKDCSERGLPMLRALFLEFPDDPGSWLVDDQYLFGSDMLVAPLFENETERNVYLPPGQWVDYQSGHVLQGGWHKLKAGKIPVVMMVRDGAVIPHIKLAQSTMQMDWSKLELTVYANDKPNVQGLVYIPGAEKVQPVSLTRKGNSYIVSSNPYPGKVDWTVKTPQRTTGISKK